MVKNHLREIRHELMIDKQIDMARLLELRQEQYNIYELQRSQPSLEIALRIARKLGRPVEEIFWLEDD
jgi:putative transcriptional regulator